MYNLTKNILRTFTTQIPSMLISIVAGIFLTRLLGAEGKGVYAFFYANIEIMVMVFAMGCDLGVVYFGSNKKMDQSKLQGLVASVLFLSVPVVALVVLLTNFDFLFIDNYDTLFFKVFLISMYGFRMVDTFISSFLRVQKAFKFINRISLINSILNVLTYSVLFYLNSKGVVEVDLKFIFKISIVILAINSLMWIGSFIKTVPFKPSFRLSFKDDIFPFFRHIFPIFIGILVNFLNYRMDIWIVSYFRDNAQLGLYVLAVNFAQFILMYSKIIGSVMMPYLSEDNELQRRNFFTVYSRVGFLTILLMVAIFAIFGETLIPFIYGNEFTGSVSPFYVLLAGMIFTSMSQLFGTMLFSKGKNNITLLANSVGLLVTVVLDFVLIPEYGIIGAAWATCASYLALFLVLLIYLLAKEKITIQDLFLLKKTDFKTLFQQD